MNIQTIATAVRTRVNGNVDHNHLLGVMRRVCGKQFDLLRGTATAPFRVCITESGKSGWVGVLFVDVGGNVFIEGQLPQDVKLRAIHRQVMAEKAAAKAADQKDALAQAMQHGVMHFGAFLADLLTVAAGGRYNGKNGDKAVEAFLSDHQQVLVA